MILPVLEGTGEVNSGERIELVNSQVLQLLYGVRGDQHQFHFVSQVVGVVELTDLLVDVGIQGEFVANREPVEGVLLVTLLPQ